MTISEFCTALDEKLKIVSDEEKLKMSALALQQAFKVEKDEVAFLKLDVPSGMICFVWPPPMSNSGSIPLQNRDSLVARTVRDSKAELHNDFSSKRHTSFFELVNLESAKVKTGKDTQNIRPKVIQKIMSAPMVSVDASLGAVQVSRKADIVKQAGPDFTDLELKALIEIARVIGKHI